MNGTLLIYGAPELSADLFHAVPTGIIDPFLYIESDGRRAATVSQLDADKVTAMGIEILDPYELGADELLSRGISRHEVDIELARRACERLGVQRALVPSEFPVGVADHLRGAGIEVVVDPEAFVGKRRVKSASRDRGHPARPAGGRRGDGGRRPDDSRGRRHQRGGPGGDAGVVRRARLRPRRRRDRLARPAVRDRPRARSRPDRRGRGRGRRHLAARPRLTLLGRHDAHVHRRRRWRRRTSSPSTGG